MRFKFKPFLSHRHPSSFGIIKIILVFYDSSHVLKHKEDIFFSFLAYKTLRAIVTLLFIIFSNHFFLIENLFVSIYIYLQKV